MGHKNPDTDSICSAIAYAELKSIITGEEYSPRRAGQINEETQYILNYFNVEVPKLITDLRVQLKDVDLNIVDGISGNTSIRKAWELMKAHNGKTLPILRDKHMEGLITVGDIAMSYMDVYDKNSLSVSRTQYRNIIDTIEGTLLVGNSHSYVPNGDVEIIASSRVLMEKYVEHNDLVILGDRQEAQHLALDLDVACMIICQDTSISQDVLDRANEKEVVVISTSHDPFTVARLINQSIPVRYFMSKEQELTKFSLNDYAEDIKPVMAQKRYNDFPVVDHEGNFLGFISRRRLINSRRKRVILMDHNEKNQAVNGIEDAEVLEIIDHHRLGSIETLGPVFFRCQPVGCTSTIVYQMYQESLTKLNKTTAGLLCAAIISDTLMFRSPTCTPLDEYAARQLSYIAGVDILELAQGMFKAGSNLKGKTADEIVLLDFKRFTVNEINIGVGQVNSLNIEELDDLKSSVQEELEQVRINLQLDMVFFMLTNIIDESTELMFAGKGARDIVIRAFDMSEDEPNFMLKGVVSRKKQLVPMIVSALQQ